MLRVIVELVPHGIEGAKHVIAKGEIINNGQGDFETGNYTYTLCSPPSRLHPQEVKESGTLQGFDRSRGSLELLMEVLKDAFEG